MRREPRIRWAVGVALAGWLAAGAAGAGELKLATVSGMINPAVAEYLVQAVEQAEADGASALLIELDTPGGLVDSTKDIIQAMLNSRVPVIVYVAPRGAWASSAGTFITVAAHVAAMAPGTSIGAASPIQAQGGDTNEEKDGERTDVSMQKAENFLAAFIESVAKERNRNVEWVGKAVREAVAVGETEALELGVIDLVAENRRELLEQIEGREVKVDGEMQTITLAGAAIDEIEMGQLQRFFSFLADPNVAFILMMAGMLGLYVEFNNPGLIVPGVVGAICLMLTLMAFQVLPFDWLGLLLILSGIGLMVAEIFFPTMGALFAAGVLALLIGGSMLFDRPELGDLSVSFWSVLVPVVAAMAAFGALVVFSVGRTFALRQTAGVDELVGLVGKAATGLDLDGRVFVRGEYWNAHADEPIGEGEAVEVVAVEGLRMDVRRVPSDEV
ncbi:MAG: nodulation protein NfeD [Proteobacteria bacterium]|nr:nodulation protein NfeD [Pseudomonadota bacterium]